MSPRLERKQEARAQRLAAEDAARRGARQRAALMRLGLVLGLAVVVVVVAILVSSGGGGPSGGGSGGRARSGDAGAANALFRGIPQSGVNLGDRSAKPTLIEYADLQCPFCAEYSNGVLPTVVDRYVKPGRVRYELHVRSFLGSDSVRAAGAAAEATHENRLYQFADLFYRRQGEENSGYVTDPFLRDVARGVGVDPSKAVSAAGNARSQPLVRQAEQQAAALGSNSTPAFFLRVKGGRLVPVQPQQLTPAAFTAALDKALKQA
jgi:protein-disulfide isomerase